MRRQRPSSISWAGRGKITLALGVGMLGLGGCTEQHADVTPDSLGSQSQALARFSSGRVGEFQLLGSALGTVLAGRRVFRHDTFGSEAFWGDTLRLHEAIAGEANGGTGPGVSPELALALGLKVDMDALDRKTLVALRRGRVNLQDPAVTVELLRQDAVVGVRGQFDRRGNLTTMGLTCALCHSTVDDALTSGVGRRLDGWANRDLNVGAIIAAAPDLSAVAGLLGVDDATLRAVLGQWGPGKFDAAVFLDGKTVGPSGRPEPTVIPSVFGLAGVNLATYTGWGSIPYWNAFVATLEMHGSGRFFDPRLNDPVKFPIAAANGFGDVRPDSDEVSSKLPALQAYQLALPTPRAPRGSYDRRAARRGKALFSGRAECSSCHVPPLYTEPGWNLHTPEEVGIDGFHASRSPTGRYRTTPLRGLLTKQKGGYYHDGRFASLAEVVDHYDRTFGLGLAPAEVSDLVHFLRTL